MSSAIVIKKSSRIERTGQLELGSGLKVTQNSAGLPVLSSGVEVFVDDYEHLVTSNDWGVAFRTASQAVATAGGGVLRGNPARKYQVGTDGVADSLTDILTGWSRLTHSEVWDVRLKIDPARIWVPGSTFNWFRPRGMSVAFRRCTHEGPAIGSATTAANLNGPVVVGLLGGCIATVEDCEFNNAVSGVYLFPQDGSYIAADGRTRNVRIRNLKVKDVVYPFHAVGNGDDIEFDITSDGGHRPFVIGWNSAISDRPTNVRGTMISKNQHHHASISAVDGCRIKYVNVVNESNGAAVESVPKIILLHRGTSAQAALRNVEIVVDVDYGAATYRGASVVQIRKEMVPNTGSMSLSSDAGTSSFDRTTGSFVSDLFPVGMVVTATGFTGIPTTDQFTITALTATRMTVTPAPPTLAAATGRSIGGTTIADPTDGRGHVIDGLAISGVVRNTGNSDAACIETSGNWGVGETIRNFAIRDLYVPDSWIDLSPESVKDDGIEIDNVTVPRGIRWRRGDDTSVPPRFGKVRVGGTNAKNKDIYFSSPTLGGTQVFPLTRYLTSAAASTGDWLGPAQYSTVITQNSVVNYATVAVLPSAQPGAKIRGVCTQNANLDLSPVFYATVTGAHTSATTIVCNRTEGLGPGDAVTIDGNARVVGAVLGATSFTVTAAVTAAAASSISRSHQIREAGSGNAVRLELGESIDLECSVQGIWETVAKTGTISYVTAPFAPATEATFYGDAADGYVFCVSTVYADAREGTGTLTAEPTTDLAQQAGQLLSGSSYYCYQGFIAFDTSSIPDTATITNPLLSFVASHATTTDIMEVFIYDWSTTVTTADFRTGTQLGSLTKVGELAATALSIGTRYTFTADAAFAANINKTGFTRLVIASQKQRTNVAPTGNHLMGHKSADNTGTTDDPRLILTYTV